MSEQNKEAGLLDEVDELNESADDFLDFGDEDFANAPSLVDNDEVAESVPRHSSPETTNSEPVQKATVDKVAKTNGAKKGKRAGKTKKGLAENSETSELSPYVQLAMPDVLYKRLEKKLSKNMSASAYIVSLLREFMSQPDWFKQLTDTFENETLDYAGHGLSRKLTPTISVYSKTYRPVARKVAKVLNTSEALVTYIMIDLQLQKGGVKSKSKLASELLGPLEI